MRLVLWLGSLLELRTAHALEVDELNRSIREAYLAGFEAGRASLAP